jgi:hypothetical protein
MVSTINSPAQLCNLALSQVGARAQIQSINPSDGTAAGDACNLLYQPTVDAFARSAHWNCLRFATGTLGSTFPPPLQLLKAATGTPEAIANPALLPPPQPWLYEYALPPDCLKARFLVPLLTQQTSPPLTTAGGMMLPGSLPAMAVPFAVAVDLDSQGNETQVLLTNLGTGVGSGTTSGGAQLVYTRRLTNIGLWDSQFTMGAKAALAVWLAPAVNGSVSLANAAMGIAKAMLDAARVSDGNEGPQSQDHEASWITARYRRGPSILNVGAYMAPWDVFSFPGGISY